MCTIGKQHDHLLVRTSNPPYIYRTSRRKQDGSFVDNGKTTRHHPSELVIELVEFFIDVLSLVFAAALPGLPGMETGGAMFTREAAPNALRVGGQLIRIDLAKFFIDVESLVIPAADPANPLGIEIGGAFGFTVVAFRKTSRGVEGQLIRIEGGIPAAVANRAGRSEHGDRQHSKH